jgi:diguanylate cyclase (GGDEF)-like protein
MDRGQLDRLGVDRLRLDGFRLDGVGVDRLGVDRLGVDGFGVDGLCLDGVRVERLGLDGLGVDGIRVDGFGVDGIRVDGFGVDDVLGSRRQLMKDGEEQAQQPDRLPALLAGIALAGMVAVIWGCSPALTIEAPPVWWLVGFALAFAAADALLVDLRFGHDTWSFTWAELVVVVGAVAMPFAWIQVSALFGVAGAHALRRRPAMKLAFNTLNCQIGIGFAHLAWLAVGGGHPPVGTARIAFGVVAASFAFYVITGATVSAAVAWSQRLPFLPVHLRGLPLGSITWVGNTALGCALVATAMAQPLALLAFPAVLFLLFLGYRAYLQAVVDRDTWQSLQAFSRRLLVGDAATMAEEALAGALELMRAEFAEIVLVQSEPGEHMVGWRRYAGEHTTFVEGDPFELAAGWWGRVVSDRIPFDVALHTASGPQQDDLADLGLASCVVAPLLIGGRCAGAVRIGFRGPVVLSGRERQIFETWANHVGAATSNVRAFDQLRLGSLVDELTGLPNRPGLTSALGDALKVKEQVAVVFLDLDRFKHLNDRLGNLLGDRVLVLVAERLVDSLPAKATVGRFGGDEFVVIWPGVATEHAAVETARRIAGALLEPIRLNGHDLTITVSTGIAIGLVDHEVTPAQLFSDAETAMRLAKKMGGDTYQLFTEKVRSHTVARLELETDLREALDHSELAVHFQAVVGLGDRRVVAAEALARWPHPRRANVGPNEFIPIAEETGLIMPLGAWVLAESVRALPRWDGIGGLPLDISINLSPRQLSAPTLTDDIEAVFEALSTDPRRVTFEITESSLLTLGDEAISRLGVLRSMGCKVALDDFGTGYSSLSYLRILPVDSLKLDRSFVAQLDVDARDRSVVESILSLAHALGLHVVAEGVERESQLDVLVDLGCDAAQGFLLHRPCPAEEMLAIVADPWSCWPASGALSS